MGWLGRGGAPCRHHGLRGSWEYFSTSQRMVRGSRGLCRTASPSARRSKGTDGKFLHFHCTVFRAPGIKEGCRALNMSWMRPGLLLLQIWGGGGGDVSYSCHTSQISCFQRSCFPSSFPTFALSFPLSFLFPFSLPAQLLLSPFFWDPSKQCTCHKLQSKGESFSSCQFAAFFSPGQQKKKKKKKKDF